MKILILNSVIDEDTSTGRLVTEIAAGLRAEGHGCDVGYSQPTDRIFEGSFKFGTVAENKIHALMSRVTGMPGYFSFFGTGQLIRRIKRERYDVVHINNVHSNDLCFPRLFRFLGEKKIPVMLTLHDCLWYTARCFHYTRRGCVQWKTGCKKCGRNARSTPYWFCNHVEKLYKNKVKWMHGLNPLTVVGVSAWITEEARQSLLSCANRIVRIYNWIENDKFRQGLPRNFREIWNVREKFVLLGVCGTWGENKGLSDLARLSGKLSEDEVMVLVGNIDNEHKKLFSDSTIFYPPTKDRAKLAGMYASADVYINLSREESFGMTNAEAMACGTPVIVYNSTASAEFVKEVGSLAEPGDIEGLCRGIREIRMKSMSAEYSKLCSDIAVRDFSKEKNIRQYIEEYKRLISAGRS